MENLFLYITRLSVKSCAVIPLIIFIRFLIRKQPKIYSYALWSVVFLCLVADLHLPLPQNTVIETPVSRLQQQLLEQYSQTLDTYTEDVEIHYTDQLGYYKAVESGIQPEYDSSTDQYYVATAADSVKSPTTVSDFLPFMYTVWIAGIFVCVAVTLKNSLDLHAKLKYSKHCSGNVYTAENLPSPFVYGIIRPKIYIPENLRLKDLSYIIAHEQTHIRRKDHIIKPVCLFITALHWFNPLVWLAFREMSRDMEMSCDEKVIAGLGTDSKKNYSLLLLDFATGKGMSATVLFGESHAENRIKNVLKYRKPAKITAAVLGVAVALCIVFPLVSDKASKTPSSAVPATFYEKLDSINSIDHLQYKYRMGVEGSSLFPHAEYTVLGDGSVYDVIHKDINYDDYPNLINENDKLSYWSMLGNRIDDGKVPQFSVCHVEPDDTFSISDYELRDSGLGVWVMQQPYPDNFPIDEEYAGARIVGHDKLSDSLYISSVITYTEDNTGTLYVVRTENGKSEIMYKGEAFTITRGIRFLNENVGFASSDFSHDFPSAKITVDGGRTWQNLDFSALAPDDEEFYVRNGCIVNIYGETVEIRYHAKYSGRQAHADDTYSVISFDGGLTWTGYYRGVSFASDRQGMKYEKATDTIPVLLAE